MDYIKFLFAYDDWRLIRKFLKSKFHFSIVFNLLYDDNALISLDQGFLSDFIGAVGKWQEWGNFHLKFEKWDSAKHSRPLVLKGYGGWIKVKNLPLDFWCRSIFEAIGDHFGGLIEIATETLNFTNCSEAHNNVKKNQCGFVLSTIEISDQKRGNIFLHLEILSF